MSAQHACVCLSVFVGQRERGAEVSECVDMGPGGTAGRGVDIHPSL